MYIRARALSEALDILSDGQCAILCGGTDFYPALVDRPRPPRILDISGIAELSRIETTPTEFRIGAGTAWSAIARADLPSCFRALQEAAREVGSIQIQNAGTLGGNVCNASPAADGVPALLVLDAEVEIASRAGCRREPLASFIRGNRRTSLRAGELVTAVAVPRAIEHARSKFIKLGARRYLVISIVMVAACIAVDDRKAVRDIRIAVGACSAVAARLPVLERALLGHEALPGLGEVVKPDHLSALSPIDDVRATASYRSEAALTLVRETIESCVAEVPRG